VTLEFPDLLAMVRICRQPGVVTALDNTWGAGLAFNGRSTWAAARALSRQWASTSWCTR
jgi:hypothetical protein